MTVTYFILNYIQKRRSRYINKSDNGYKTRSIANKGSIIPKSTNAAFKKFIDYTGIKIHKHYTCNNNKYLETIRHKTSELRSHI